MIELPDGVTLRIEDELVIVKGPKGEERRTFRKDFVTPSISGKKFEVKGDHVHVGSLEGHVKNLINGVTKGFVRKFKAIYAHFPVSFEVKGKEFIIKNFLGEKQPRKANIIGNTKIEVKGVEVTISSTNREHLGQTVSNIKGATKIKKRDSRVFQDGLYEVEQS